MEKQFKLNLQNLSVNEDGKVMTFSTVAAYIGVPTDQTPSTSEHGWHVVLDPQAAAEAVSGMVGMGVNVCWSGRKEFCKHDAKFKIGVVDEAHIEDNKILCSGHIWQVDFPDVCEALRENRDFLGTSVEFCAFSVDSNDESKVKTVKDFAFTGLSIVYKNKAAFMGTNFMCSVLEENNLTDEEIKSALDAQGKAQDEKINAKFNEFSTAITKTVTEGMAALKAELSAKPEEKHEEAPTEKAELSAEAISKAVSDAVTAAFAGVKEELSKKDEAPKKASKQAFSAFERYGSDKSMMELSAEIDKDSHLSDADKWKTKLALWKNAQAAGLAE